MYDGYVKYDNFLGSTHKFETIRETFGITSIPSTVLHDYAMIRSSNRPTEMLERIPSEVLLRTSALPIAKLPRKKDSGGSIQHDYLAYRQGCIYAVTPVHTTEEYRLFRLYLEEETKKRLIFSHKKDKAPNFIHFAREWSSQADGKNIFYKTPEDLTKYFNIFYDRSKFVKTVLSHESVCKTVKQTLQNLVRDTRTLEANSFSIQGLYPVISETPSGTLPPSSTRNITPAPPSLQLYTSSTHSASSQQYNMPRSFSMPRSIATISENYNQLPQKRSLDSFTKKKFPKSCVLCRDNSKNATCPGRYDNKKCPDYRATFKTKKQIK
jgi:hypothetical protein